ncbi:MAG: pyrrolo-quinoline quinone, partial [Oscillospiraceae bacterium]
MPNNKRKKPSRGKKRTSTAGIFIFLALLCVLVVVVVKNFQAEPEKAAEVFNPVAETPVVASIEPATPTPVESSDSSLPDFNPKAVDATKPEQLIKETGIMVDGQPVDSYSIKDKIDFSLPEDYTSVEGIVTFRGNNFRNSGSYGTADIVNKKFSDNHWTVQEASLQSPNGTVWTGSGWVGQPLMMTWPKEVRAHMNMYDWAKNADTLTEVIYATMDGNIYFLDLATGQKTRDNMYLGYTFKGVDLSVAWVGT